MNKNKLFLYFLLFILHSNMDLVHGQINLEEKDYYTWFDEVVGDGNIELYNGTVFLEEFKTKSGNHRFFLDNSYNLGDLVYDNQAYYNVYVKYDIYNDQLIAKLPYQSNHLYIKLLKEKVTLFKIEGNNANFSTEKYSFINAKSELNIRDDSFKGYYQVLYRSNTITLIKKNYKKREQYIENNHVFNKFSKKSSLAILVNNRFYSIKSKRNMIRIFPTQKIFISRFYKKNRKLLTNNKDMFYTNLCKGIQMSVNKTDKKI